ncbi:FMN-binding negative transcriptional regulator [Maricaulis sp. CAU 1757]
MYTPPHNKMDDQAQMRSFIRANDFAILLIPGEPDLAATHIPMRLADEREVLIGHVARMNPASEAILAGKEAMAIFPGPHAYISPTWYADPSVNVPTWNYVTVHVHGKLVPLAGTEAERSLSAQIADFEEEWRITDIPEPRRTRLEAAIQCFELEITRMEGKAKLSQNKSLSERARLIEALQARGEHAIAYFMDEEVEEEG